MSQRSTWYRLSLSVLCALSLILPISAAPQDREQWMGVLVHRVRKRPRVFSNTPRGGPPVLTSMLCRNEGYDSFLEQQFAAPRIELSDAASRSIDEAD